ncbi:MAG: Glu-tRNA(Gln) amidotransferase subunit GatE [Nanoarchaeota archaeon]|nr:Glu-tRNA(Gln) amidotransferase subunit GatE [Nanoarchaeota archaeon]
MEKIDYKKAGLKCGIEIHQRLETHKLFCSCPSVMIEDESKVEVKKIVRQLRAVAGETGDIDVAARHEMAKGTYFVYHYYPATNCLVELDEEPPHPMNEEALNIVLQVSKMMYAKVMDEFQVMRKTVVNGSNTTGFQRTALVATNGYIEVEGNRIGISSILIEEEAAKDIEKGVDNDGRRYVVYGLDRLGIPLIEIGTDPDITTPEQCRAVSEHIGMLLRSTGKVARGIGTIRQDVNISIKNGARIEIKGAQDLKLIPTWVENEAKRQIALIEIQRELERRKAKLEPFSKELTDVFRNTECKFVSKAIKEGSIALGFTLNGFSGLLGKETQPGKRLGTELSDYAKAKTGIGGIIHSDEDLKKYNFSEKEIEATKKALNAQENAFIIIIAKKETAEIGMKAVIERAQMCFKGVPKEVRQPNPDGTTSFMRPIPGAARMYPETDIKPIRPDTSGIELPELLTEKKGRFIESLNLGKDLAQVVAKSGKAELFEEFAKKYKNVKPAFIAEAMFSTPKNLKRKYGVDETRLKDPDFEKIFDLLNKGDLTKDAVEDVLLKMCKGEKLDIARYKPLSDKELEEEIKKIVKASKGLEFNALVGKVMGTLKGRADGKKIIEMMRKLVY